MRQAIFRTLAGLLAIGFAWGIYLRPLGWRDLPSFLGQVSVMLMFAAYAVFGNRLASVTPAQLEPDEFDEEAYLQEPPDKG